MWGVLKIGLIDFFKSKVETRIERKIQNNISLNDFDRILKSFWFGDDCNDFVTDENAMKFGAVSTCVSIIASDLGMLPLELRQYRDVKNKYKGSDIAFNHPLYYLFTYKANEMMVSYNYKERIMSDLLLSGNHYSYKVINMLGQVVELKPLDWQYVEPTYINGEIVYCYKDFETNEIIKYPRDLIFHVSGYGNGFIGKSPVAIKMDSIKLGRSAEKFAQLFYNQGLNASGVITMPGKIRDTEGLRKELKEKYQGLKKSHDVMVLEDGMKFEKLVMPLKEAQFIETRKFQALDIASWYRMPPKFLQDHTYSTFSNNEQQDLDYMKHTLLPWGERLENFCNCYLLTRRNIQQGYFFQIDYNTMLKPDSKTRADVNHIKRQDGVITGNEWRTMDGMNPSEIEEQDQFIINGNMRNISIVNSENNENKETLLESGDDIE